jgi:hypothetical protein
MSATAWDLSKGKKPCNRGSRFLLVSAEVTMDMFLDGKWKNLLVF